MRGIRRILSVFFFLLFIFLLPGVRAFASADTISDGIDYEAVYDYEYYINRYPDLKAAFGSNRTAAFQHFLRFGMKEGRQASPDFDPVFYRSNYPDLNDAFGDNMENYYRHYIRMGMAERRIAASGDSGGRRLSSAPASQDSAGRVSQTGDRLPVIVLDAGHGGTDPGCVRGTTYEKNITLAVVLETARILESRGYTVILTRDADFRIRLAERTAVSNSCPDAVFVSVHVNTLSRNNSHSGMEIYCNEQENPGSERLARHVIANAASVTGARTGKIVTDSLFYVVKNNSHPSCLIEIGFLSSNTEYQKLVTDSYQKKVASGIADGITVYLTQP